MTRRARLGIALSAALPTLATALVVFTALAIAGVLPWTVLPAVLVALAAQAVVTFVRLGRLTDSAARQR
ncbi:hypothetical protein OG500_14150 [Kitasatospora sp. NBC_01250]|uniref:hypothetical protein n=1 Tax=Kitasatospora sp. NBC_01250 TaxID=2903571 RepID=UPI002E33E956|nr:hypothetical protein [Kitasatospora sp. NBC_01250]